MAENLLLFFSQRFNPFLGKGGLKVLDCAQFVQGLTPGVSGFSDRLFGGDTKGFPGLVNRFSTIGVCASDR